MDVESGFQELDKRPGVLAFVAGATLIGGIAIGKAAIDAGHRVTPKPGTDTGKALDESVRFVGTLFGIAVTLVQLPKAWEEAKKLIAAGGF